MFLQPSSNISPPILQLFCVVFAPIISLNLCHICSNNFCILCEASLLAVSVKYLRSRSAAAPRGKKAAGFVKMGDVEKGIKGEEGAKNKLERQETDTSAEVGHQSRSAEVGQSFFGIATIVPMVL